MSKSRAIEQFLATGEVNPSWSAWAGDARAAGAAMCRILERILVHRANGAPLGRRTVTTDCGEILVERVERMVRGLFPPDAAERILVSLPSCLRVVTVDGFAAQVAELDLADAWCLANIVLEDMGAPPLSDGAPQLDGLCLGQTMWVPPGALSPPSETSDVLVHEVAHLLHTAPSRALDMDRSGPPIPLARVHHETFAYSCELWACRERMERPPTGWMEDVLDRVYMADARVDIASLRGLLTDAESGGWDVLRRWAEGAAGTG